ncbi:hypothetical protein [Mesorhizobium sp. M1B.F.Ca.ET.045.04.1.1]|nr:hypothetical protein [Mesorhizobium sp. M1B.F.Ca.ET.045.04.1.1]
MTEYEARCLAAYEWECAMLLAKLLREARKPVPEPINNRRNECGK